MERAVTTMNSFREQVFLTILNDLLRNEVERLKRVRFEYGSAQPRTYTDLALIANDATAEVLSVATKMSKSSAD